MIILSQWLSAVQRQTFGRSSSKAGPMDSAPNWKRDVFVELEADVAD
jgi:hypothetical protein